jgi:hypothetical protein
MVAKNNIQQGIPILSLPAKFIITSFDEFLLTPYIHNLRHALRLIARIVYEKFMQPKALWIAKYIRGLPNSFSVPVELGSAEREYFVTMLGENSDAY